MNLEIHNFTKNNKIKKKYICNKHKGNNISPKISWNYINNTISYAIIFEDPNAINGTFIHWYIPYIDKNILKINELKHSIKISNLKYDNTSRLVQGKNSFGEFRYYGPCAPNNVNHNYKFIIYALDNKINLNNDSISIKDHQDFENILLKNNIKILNKDIKIFKYKYMNYL